jgi:hypothetical protein
LITDLKVSKSISLILLFSILFLLPLLIGCGGGSGGSATSPAPTVSSRPSFTGCLYAPSARGDGPAKAGLKVLMAATAPSGYSAVPEAQVYAMDKPGEAVSTDSGGKFTFIFDRSGKALDEPDRLLIQPTGSYSDYAPISIDAYPQWTAPTSKS